MQIEIIYCVPWGFKPNAVSLAEEIQNVVGSEVTLIKGTDGIFDVNVNGRCLFSRSETGRFPEPGEISAMIKSSESS